MSQTNHHPRKSAPASSSPPNREALPPWLPVGQQWNALPAAVRQAVFSILVPAYRQFVLDAPDELQRSIGLTLVHLLWLEICDQTHLGEVVADPTCLAATLNKPEERLDRHLSLVAAKSQTAELLMKLRLVNQALTRPPISPLPSEDEQQLNSPLPLGEGQGVRVADPAQQSVSDNSSDIHPSSFTTHDSSPIPMIPMPIPESVIAACESERRARMDQQRWGRS